MLSWIRAAICTPIPPSVIAAQFALARVHSDPQLAAQSLGSGASQPIGADCARGSVKGGEHAVAGRLHDAAAILTICSLDVSWRWRTSRHRRSPNAAAPSVQPTIR